MPMLFLSKWQRVALPMRWSASVRALFYCYLTFLDHRTNISRKSARTEACQRVRSPKQVSKLSLGQNIHGRNKPVPPKKGIDTLNCAVNCIPSFSHFFAKELPSFTCFLKKKRNTKEALAENQNIKNFKTKNGKYWRNHGREGKTQKVPKRE